MTKKQSLAKTCQQVADGLKIMFEALQAADSRVDVLAVERFKSGKFDVLVYDGLKEVAQKTDMRHLDSAVQLIINELSGSDTPPF